MLRIADNFFLSAGRMSPAQVASDTRRDNGLTSVRPSNASSESGLKSLSDTSSRPRGRDGVFILEAR